MQAVDIAGPVIKICGITTVQDAEASVASGATALGFNFYPQSSRYVSVDRARDIARCVPSRVLKVGIFVNASLEQLAVTSTTVPLDVVQLHGDILNQVPSIRMWRAIAVDKHFNSVLLSDCYEAYLLDSPSQDFGGSGKAFDWSLAAKSTPSVRLVVAGGLDASNVAAAIAALHPWGVDACSRLESQPGRKDPAKVQAFVEAARAAFECLAPDAEQDRAPDTGASRFTNPSRNFVADE